MSPVIDGISDGVGNIFVPFIPVGNSANPHDAHIARDTVDANLIVANRPDNSSYMCAMSGIRTGDIIISIIPLGFVLIIVAHDTARGEIRIISVFGKMVDL